MWIKATYNDKVKRIHNPPKNYQELIETLLRRFHDLRVETSKDPENIEVLLSYHD